MRKNRQRTCHYRYVLPGTGRNASLSSRSHCAQFLLAHLVAFQHTILHPILGGHRSHQFRNFPAPSREPLHAVHCRRPTGMTRCTSSHSRIFHYGRLRRKGCVHLRGFEGIFPEKRRNFRYRNQAPRAQGSLDEGISVGSDRIYELYEAVAE
jgi:hypothetical protein